MALDLAALAKERISAFLGQKSSVPHGLLTNNDCESIKNFVTTRGRLRKMWGVTIYEDVDFGVGEMKWLDYFRNRWLFQRGDSIGVESGENGQSFFQIGTIYGGTERRVFSDKWTDLLFLSNGYENRLIDFESLDQPDLLYTGLLPPGGGVLLAGTYPPANFSVVVDGSSLVPTGNHQYLITLWDDLRKVESMPYGSFVGEDGLWLYDQDDDNNFTTDGTAVAVAAANRAVHIDVAPILARGFDNARVTHYIIYRKASDDTYKRVPLAGTSSVDITAIGSTTFVDQAAEAALGAVLDLSLSPPPSGKYYRDSSEVRTMDYGPRFVKFHRDQLWYFGVNFPGTEDGYEVGTGPSRFYPINGVAYGSRVGFFDHWQYSYSVGRETGQKDTFMGKHANTLMFFKEKCSFYLDGTSPLNYEIRDLDSKRGISVSGSAQETSAGIIGLGQEGFVLFDGVSRGKVISDEIADMVRKIRLEYADKITSSYDPEEEKYECHCPIENTYNTLVFVLDLKSMTWSFHKRAGGAAAYGLTSNKRVVGLLGDRQNGRLYLTTDRSSMTFNGQTMHGVWRSRQLDWGAPSDLKTLQAVTIVARARRDFRISIDVIPDFSQRDAVSVNDIEPDVRNGALAEDADDPEGINWDEGQWDSGMQKKEFTILVQAMGRKMQLIVRNSDTDADRANFEIEEITLFANVLGGDDD